LPKVRGNGDAKGANKAVDYIRRNTGMELEENKVHEVL